MGRLVGSRGHVAALAKKHNAIGVIQHQRPIGDRWTGDRQNPVCKIRLHASSPPVSIKTFTENYYRCRETAREEDLAAGFLPLALLLRRFFPELPPRLFPPPPESEPLLELPPRDLP